METFTAFENELVHDESLNTLNESEIINFPNIESFELWKKSEGEEKGFRFINLRTNKLNNGMKKVTYGCHRSSKKRIQNYLPSGGASGNSRPIQKDSAKVGCKCRGIAIMNQEQSSNSSISVTYYPRHSNHTPGTLEELGKLRHTKESIDEIQELIEKRLDQHNLRQHLLLNDIELNNISQNNEIPRVNRFFTRDDLYHLVSSVHKQKYWKDDNEFKSVEIWKIYLEERGFKVYYQDPQYSRGGFAFGFVSEWQLTLLQDEEVGSTVCLDATHGTNSHGMLLYSIVIKHSAGFGVPCAFLITRDKSQDTLEQWLRNLQSVGLNPKYFMIDVSEVETSAIRNAYLLDVEILYCWFHVKQAWKRQVRAKLNSANDEAEALDHLNALLYAENPEELNQIKIDFENRWRENVDFWNYINRYYFAKFPSWSKAYRSTFHGRIDTNNYIERWHKQLKYNFLKNKPNRRLDRLIYILTNGVTAWYRQVSVIHNN